MAQPLFVRPLKHDESEVLALQSKSSNREEAWRAEVVLLSAAGETVPSISKTLGFHPSNVKKWIRKFNDAGLGGIAVRKRGPRQGPKPKFTRDQIEKILLLARTNPASLGLSFSKWTTQKLASAAIQRGLVERISHVTIRQILMRHEVNLSEVEREAKGVSVHDVKGSSFDLGKEALNNSEFERAAGYFYAALAADGNTPEDEAVIRSLLSRALEELSKYEEAYTVIRKYEDAHALALLSPRTRASVRLRIGWVNSWLWNPPRAIASLNEAMKLFLELQDEMGVSEAHYALGRTYIVINEFRIARDHLLAAANSQRTEINRELLARIYDQLGTADFNEGAFSSSKEHYLKALEFAEGSSNTNLLGTILVNLGTTCDQDYLGEREQSARYIRRAIGYLEKGRQDFLALAYNNLADLVRYSGLWDEATECLNKSVRMAQRFADPRIEATARITLAEILSARGKFAQAEEQLKRSLDLIAGSADKWTESNALLALATVHRGAGQMQAALKCLRQALRLLMSIGDLHGVTLAQVALAEVHFFQGGVDQAREYLELAQARLKEEKSLFVSGLIQRLAGQLEAVDGRVAEAKQHISQSISIFTTTEIPYELARSHYEMGLLLDKLRDTKAAKNHLLQAKEIFEKLGAEPHVELAAKALQAIDSGAQAGPDSQVEEVTPIYARVAAVSDALLMQRLIDASASRELLLEELATVIFEHFPVKGIVISSAVEGKHPDAIVTQGMSLPEAASLCRSLDLPLIESGGRFGGGYVVKLNAGLTDSLARQDHAWLVILCVDEPDTFEYARLQPLLRQVEQGLEVCSLRAAARMPVSESVEYRVQTIMPGFIISSATMSDVIEKIHKIRTSDVTVLITGESGTGKELVARAIHAESARARAIFLPFNCTATPKDIIDSQLFGHRRGAFTGATTNYPGIIRAADGGTLFLDEIGDLALEVQPKLMRFLQEGEIQPLGETKPIRVDVRVLAATNSDLERAVSEGRFREDLFHRLNIIRIHVPPLRERREEVPALASHFLSHFASRSGKQGVRLTNEAIEALCAYEWPGNVRQLRNEMERVVAYASEDARILVNDLSPEVTNSRRSSKSGSAFGAALGQSPGAPRSWFGEPAEDRAFAANAGSGIDGTGGNGRLGQPLKLKEATAELERQLIIEALARNKNNLTRTASDIGLSRRGLRLKLTQLRIDKQG